MNSSAIKMLLSDTAFKVRNADELRRELDIETAKQIPDTDVINELVLSIIEAERDVKSISNLTYEVVEKQEKTIRVKRSRMRYASIVAATLLLLGNIAVFSIIDKNMSRAPDYASELSELGKEADLDKYSLQINEYGLSFLDTRKTDNSTVEVSKNDPYGIKRFLKEYDIEFEAPEWLPDDLIKTNFIKNDPQPIWTLEFKNHEIIDGDEYSMYSLEKDERKIMITFTVEDKPYRSNMMGTLEYIREIELNGHSALLVKYKEELVYTLHFRRNEVYMTMLFNNLTSEEVYKIIYSIN